MRSLRSQIGKSELQNCEVSALKLVSLSYKIAKPPLSNWSPSPSPSLSLRLRLCLYPCVSVSVSVSISVSISVFVSVPVSGHLNILELAPALVHIEEGHTSNQPPFAKIQKQPSRVEENLILKITRNFFSLFFVCDRFSPFLAKVKPLRLWWHKQFLDRHQRTFEKSFQFC